MQDPVFSITTLARPLVPKHPTNRAIIILTVLATILALALVLLDGGSFGSALRSAFSSGVTVLLTWMIGREVDPEYDLSAFVGVGLAFLAILLQTTPPALLVLGILLPILRIVNRTVGPPALRLDTAIIVVGALILVFLGRWQLALVAGAALAMDGVLSPAHRFHLFVSPVVVVGLALYALISGIDPAQSITLPYLLGAIAITILSIYVLINTRTLTVRADLTRRPLILTRVRAGMIVALIAVWLYMWNGDAGVQAMSPLWMTLLGVGIYRVVQVQILKR